MGPRALDVQTASSSWNYVSSEVRFFRGKTQALLVEEGILDKHISKTSALVSATNYLLGKIFEDQSCVLLFLVSSLALPGLEHNTQDMFNKQICAEEQETSGLGRPRTALWMEWAGCKVGVDQWWKL